MRIYTLEDLLGFGVCSFGGSVDVEFGSFPMIQKFHRLFDSENLSDTVSYKE